jgi:hypothetical protein
MNVKRNDVIRGEEHNVRNCYTDVLFHLHAQCVMRTRSKTVGPHAERGDLTETTTSGNWGPKKTVSDLKETLYILQLAW